MTLEHLRDNDLKALERMAMSTSKFERAVADAALWADNDNYAALRNALPHVWAKFGATVGGV